ncbi:hypothetical protein M011DRAFT_64363 [Sporormia fimetaria CBS 119925]|uniref:MOSC domain-containing protein n=1 Tax=Sporormia fimetaria CBS 119925 TaxID=1340428 RepID=A0A6A6VDF2_9PLEO|nr:hypothetical protein M011DRAFT_64363 [Sporormia fimetaria CBS 119925]
MGGTTRSGDVEYVHIDPRLFYSCLAILLAAYYYYHQILNAPPRSHDGSKPLKISEIYVYPIKSLRGTRVKAALATKNGFQYDRTFMLLKVTPEGLKNMLVAQYYEMTQFLTSIEQPTVNEKKKPSLKVDFVSPKGPKVDPLIIPLEPDTTNLETLDVTMHRSSTSAFKMPTEYNAWFSKCFGYEVVLAYLGPNRRDVLFEDLKSSLDEHQITFSDCAPYMVASKTSLSDVSSRFSDGKEMDMTKFRPNIVVEGAQEPWQEDFWAELNINGVNVPLAHNCVRCRSINVDYATGEQAPGEEGEVLKKLQKDRRVDPGMKWSPVFGRYGYWKKNQGPKPFSVGDEVFVTKVNKERTTWTWKSDWGAEEPAAQ